MIKIDFYNKTFVHVSKNIFLELLPRAFKLLCRNKRIKPQKTFLIELTLTDKEFIARLNKKYFKKNSPTDVISLSYSEGLEKGSQRFKKFPVSDFCGEIFICASYARKQAEKLKHSFKHELQFLFIHGLLHVFGYDHKKPADAALMEKSSRRILAAPSVALRSGALTRKRVSLATLQNFKSAELFDNKVWPRHP